ncbi:MAG: hypothetical protein ACP5O2_08835 [Bacteroidales bacterium]
MIKKVIPRLVAVLMILVLLNQIYTRYIYPHDLKKIDLADSLARIKDTCQILYLGESSNFSFSWGDHDRRRISDFVADYYPSLSLGTLNKGALHAGIYLRLLEQIPTQSKLETVIVTVNLRSFGPDWIHSKLENVLQRDILLLSPGPKLWNRFRMGLKAYYNPNETQRKALQQWHYAKDPLGPECPYPTAQAWMSAIKENKAQPPLTLESERKQALNFIRLFAFSIDTLSNPRIHDLDRIARLARQRGWHLIFNLLSENVEKARQLTGQELPNLMQRNRDILVKRYSGMGVVVVDNLATVDSAFFIDKDWPTEHYTEPGRKAVARKVALALKEFYPAAFFDVKRRTLFLNDFERPAVGFSSSGTNQTKARSGRHAFALYPDRPYCPSFYLTTENTDFQGPFTLKIETWFNGNPKPKELKLVISLKNKDDPKIYKVFYVDDATHETWKPLRCETLIEQGLREGDLLTAYVWHSGQDTVYVDDFSVRIIPVDSTAFVNFARTGMSQPHQPTRL